MRALWRARVLDWKRGPDCERAKVVTHPGGHFLPSQRPWLDAAIGFVKECLEQAALSDGRVQKVDIKGEDDHVENMDVPF